MTPEHWAQKIKDRVDLDFNMRNLKIMIDH